MPNRAIRTTYNALDTASLGDAVPASAWLGREYQNNDRFLAATEIKNVFAKAWDISAPNGIQYLGGVEIYRAAWRSTPHVKTITVSGRGIVTNLYTVYVAVETTRRPAAFHGGDPLSGGWTTLVGTGAVANWDVQQDVYADADEEVVVYVAPQLNPSAAADVTGAVTTPMTGNLVQSAALFGPVAVGWAIRIEEGGGGGRPLTAWHVVIAKVNPSNLIVRPAWRQNEQASGQYGGGAAQFRARQIARLDLRSLSCDEDPLTGQWGT